MAEVPRPSCVGAAPWFACTELTSTVDHYRDVLGFDRAWHWLWGDPPDHAGVSRGQTRMLFFEDADRAARSRGYEVVIYVKGVAALYGKVILASYQENYRMAQQAKQLQVCRYQTCP